jgi:competence protein ComEA
MNWSEFVVDYLSFTKKEKIAILVITLLIIGVFFLPLFVSRHAVQAVPVTDTNWVAAIRKLEQKETEKTESGYREDNGSHYQYDRSAASAYSKPTGILFIFDPNTLTEEGWQRLGIREKTIRTIKNYLSKGGQFRKPEDLQRVYGLFPNEYERIAPYIKIEPVNASSSNYTEYPKNFSLHTPAKTISPRYSVVELNSADTAALVALPGIGSKLALRIINFRDKLGGFYSVNQVGEIYGLPDSTFQKLKQYLKIESIAVRKININTASVDELKAHPYIKYSLANPIIAYRNEHGPFLKMEDIKKVMVVTEEVYTKIAPYLAIQ